MEKHLERLQRARRRGGIQYLTRNRRVVYESFVLLRRIYSPHLPDRRIGSEMPWPGTVLLVVEISRIFPEPIRAGVT